MVHLGVENKLGPTTCTSIVDKFAYCSFDMSFNISPQGVTIDFHTPSDVSMGGGEYSHIPLLPLMCGYVLTSGKI
jgi:hypothetical protein